MTGYQIKAVYPNGSNVAKVYCIYSNGSRKQIAVLHMPLCGDVKEASDMVEAVVKSYKKMLQIK